MMLYVVRHGETAWNIEERVQGATDIDLTDVGRMEAYELQKLVAEVKVDAVFSSPLKRARETAEILINGKLPIELDDRLIERSWGDNEGKFLTDVDRYKCWDISLNIGDNNIEKVQDFMQRVADFIEAIRETYHDKKVLIVCHSAVVRVIHYLLGIIPEDGNLSRMEIPNLRILEYKL